MTRRAALALIPALFLAERATSTILTRLHEVGTRRLWAHLPPFERLRRGIGPLLEQLEREGMICRSGFFAFSREPDPYGFVVDFREPWIHIGGELRPDGFRLYSAREIEWAEDFQTGERVRV